MDKILIGKKAQERANNEAEKEELKNGMSLSIEENLTEGE